MKHHLPTAHLLQLAQSGAMVAGFADLGAVQRGDLIRADHQRTRDAFSDRLRLGLRQAQRGGARQFAGQRAFVDVGRERFERQAQAREQLAAVGGAGCKNQTRNQARNQA